MYNETGDIIDDVIDIKDDETLYVSEGEEFLLKNLENQTHKRILKFCVIGSPSVFNMRCTQGKFIDECSPFFEIIFKKDIMIGDQCVGIDISDISGMNEYMMMRLAWFKERPL